MKRRQLPVHGILWAAALVGLLMAFPRPAAAQQRWLKLDRVEAEPTWVKGMVQVRAYVTAVNVYGGMVPIGGKKAWALKAGGKKLRSAYFAMPFRTQDDVFLLGLVIQTSKENPIDTSQPHSLTEVKPAAIHFLESLPKTTRIALVTYDEQVNGRPRLESLTNVTTKLRKLAPSKKPQAALTKAVRQAIKAINKYKPKGTKKGRRVRRAIVVIADGRDSQWPKPKAPDYAGAIEEARKLGKLADRTGIRIHSIGYSAENWRRPLLMLGELSKRTHGTFRLAQSYDSFEVLLRSLHNEIERQYVLTFYVPEKRVKGRKLSLVSGKLESNVLRLKKIRCGDQICKSDEFCSAGCTKRKIKDGPSILRWVMYIVGGVVGLFAVLVFIGFLMSRRENKRAAHAALADAGQEGGHAAPPDQVDGRQTVQPQANPYAQGQPAPAQPRGHQAQPQPQGRVQPQANPYAQQQQPGMTPGQPNRQARRSHVAVSGPTLLIIKGEQQGRQLQLHHNFRIGKAPNSDLAIPNDPYASTDHAYIQMDRGGNCTLVDNHSTNGTFVNGVRVNQRKLTSGMLIRIGATEMRFLTQ